MTTPLPKESTGDNKTKKPSKSFWKEYVGAHKHFNCTDIVSSLLDFGLYSDITFIYGKYHVFNLHSLALNSKSKWFADQCGKEAVEQPEKFAFAMDSLPKETLDLFKQLEVKPCSSQCIESYCQVHDLVREALTFCYLGDMPFQNQKKEGGAQLLCEFCVFVYLLSKKFNISSLLYICRTRFAFEMESLLRSPVFPEIINLVYNLPELDQNDALRRISKSLVERFANSEVLRIQTNFLREVKRSKTARAMPRAAQELLRQSMETSVSNLTHVEVEEASATSADINFRADCKRCSEPVDDVKSELYKPCQETNWKSTFIYFPAHRKDGITMTFCKCRKCSQVWSCDEH